MEKKRFGRRAALLMMMTLLLTFGCASAALADQWVESKGKISYVQGKNNKKAKGLTKIGKKTFYFSKKGVMQTGFVKVGKSVYYFKKKGNLGTVGSMAKGWITLDTGIKYYLDPKTGELVTGLQKVKNYTYFFSLKKPLGERGARLVSRTRTYKKKTYYFNERGRMVTNAWVDDHYYGADGAMMKNALTPDGYIVDAKGLKGKKVKSKKEIEVGGVTYRYDTKAKEFVVKHTAKVLIIAGHGQGDAGASSVLGQESRKTREFASLIYKELQASPVVIPTMYNQSYDCYQVMSGKKSGPNPNFKQYDYVLEIHFDAAGVKDIGGDGRYKGVCMLVSVNKKSADRRIDAKIINSIVSTGFRQFAGGVISDMAMLRHTLFNASTCARQGVNYGLLETAFIDDADDMRFYNKNKSKMAKAVADSITDYFS